MMKSAWVDYARWHATEDRGNRFCPPALLLLSQTILAAMLEDDLLRLLEEAAVVGIFVMASEPGFSARSRLW
jgi:hypothetical protein